MDDFLASQQLVEEGAHAEHATADDGGKSPTPEDIADGSGEEQPIDLATQSPAPSQQTMPSSPPSAAIDNPPSLIHTGEDLAVSQPVGDESASQPQSEVEVPDSQLGPAAPHWPITPSPSSSFAIPATLDARPTQKKTKARKSQKSLLAEVNNLNSVVGQGAPSNDKGNSTAMSAESPPAPASETKRRRKKCYATPPPTTKKFEPIKPITRKKRGSLIQALHESARDKSMDVDNATTPSNTTNGRLKHVERKPPLSARPSNDEDDQIPEVSETPLSKKPKKPKQSSSTKASDVVETLATSRKRKRKVKAKAVEVIEPHASAGATEEPDAGAMHEDPLLDAENMSDASSSVTETAKPKKERKQSQPPATNKPAPRFTRKSNVDLSIYAADRELNNYHDLNHPPVLPGSGKFTQDEDEILRRAISDYQQRSELSTPDLVAVIQWTNPSLDPRNTRKKSDWNKQEVEEEKESKAFWAEILATKPELGRKPDIIKGHVQARYHTFKSGGWTEEEDELLKDLMEKHPSQWKTISLIMTDRSAADIHNRWKDYVQYGEQRNTSRWTRAEEESLVSALATVIQRDEDERAAIGLPSLAEYTNKDINWPAVCDVMGNIRSRLQCTVKWTLLKKRDASINSGPVHRRGRTSDPTRVAGPTPKQRKKKREANGGETGPQNKRVRARRSKAYVNEDDLGLDEANSDEADPHGDPESSVASKKPRKSRAKQFKAQDPVEEVEETDDNESPATKNTQQRQKPTKLSRTRTEAAIKEVPGQEVVALEEEDAEAASEEVYGEGIATPEEHDEQRIVAPEEDVDEVASTEVHYKDTAASRQAGEVASEDVNDDDVAAPAELDDQEEAAIDTPGNAASEGPDEDDIAPPISGSEPGVATAEQDVELEVPALEEDRDQGEEAVQEHGEDEITTPAQYFEEVATPEDEDVQDGAAVEVYDPSEPSDSVRQEKTSTRSQMSNSSTLKTSPQPQRSAQELTGISQMEWDDILDIIQILIFQTETMDVDDVAWDELAATLQKRFSPSELESAVRELLTLVPHQSSWPGTLKALRRHIRDNVDTDKQNEHHGPKVNTALLEEAETRTEPSGPKSTKKRKRDAQDSSAKPRSDKKRKRRSSMPRSLENTK